MVSENQITLFFINFQLQTHWNLYSYYFSMNNLYPSSFGNVIIFKMEIICFFHKNR